MEAPVVLETVPHPLPLQEAPASDHETVKPDVAVALTAKLCPASIVIFELERLVMPPPGYPPAPQPDTATMQAVNRSRNIALPALSALRKIGSLKFFTAVFEAGVGVNMGCSLKSVRQRDEIVDRVSEEKVVIGPDLAE